MVTIDPVKLEEEYFYNNPKANDIIIFMNCFDNVSYGSQNWVMAYCITITLEAFGYFVLSILLGFLLALHCMMFKKAKGKCSWQVFKRDRV